MFSVDLFIDSGIARFFLGLRTFAKFLEVLYTNFKGFWQVLAKRALSTTFSKKKKKNIYKLFSISAFRTTKFLSYYRKFISCLSRGQASVHASWLRCSLLKCCHTLSAAIPNLCPVLSHFFYQPLPVVYVTYTHHFLRIGQTVFLFLTGRTR